VNELVAGASHSLNTFRLDTLDNLIHNALVFVVGAADTWSDHFGLNARISREGTFLEEVLKRLVTNLCFGALATN
jgi:hypothetical protein